MSEIEDIKTRLDLVDIISQYVTLKKAGANHKGVCPFHDERTPSMMVSQSKQIWKCFGCGKGGDVFSFVMEAESLGFGDALKLLADRAGVTLKPKTFEQQNFQTEKERLYRVNRFVCEVFHRLLLEEHTGKSAMKYLNSRGITKVIVENYKIGLAPNGFHLSTITASKGINEQDLAKVGSPQKFFNRIIFPIFDVLGHVIGFTGRTLGDNEPKYLNTPETQLFNKSRVLYGLNVAKKAITQKDQVILVEGQMDVIAMHRSGFVQTVASSGTAFTDTQATILSRYTPNFYLLFDTDAAGTNATKKVIEMLLAKDLNVRVIDVAPFKDAGEAIEGGQVDKIVESHKNATEAMDWLIEQESSGKNLNYIEEKKAILKKLSPTMALIKDAARQDYYFSLLAGKLGLSKDSIKAAFGDSKLLSNSPTNKRIIQQSTKLTNEEQLVALVLSNPSSAVKIKDQFDELIFSSQFCSQIAEEIKRWYNNSTLVKNPNSLLSEVKKSLDSQDAQKIDAWLLHMSELLPTQNDETVLQIFNEKIKQLDTRSKEQIRQRISTQIREAQGRGDLDTVKKLIKELTNLTKEK